MDRLVIGFMIGILFIIFNYFIEELFKSKWRKQCNYNCDKCKVWDCQYHLCHSRILKKRKEED